MSLLIFAIVIVLLAVLVIALIQRAPVLDATMRWVLEALVVIVAILVIASRAGLG